MIYKDEERLSTKNQANLASDILDGVGAYAAFTGLTERRCNHLLATKQLPGGKLGRKWIGSKVAVRDHLAKLSGSKA